MKTPPDPAWPYWFVGFCDGEASFTYKNTKSKSSPVRPIFKLTVQDDHTLIAEANEILFGGGYVSIDKPVGALRDSGSSYSNRSELNIADKVRLQMLVDFFDTYPLRSHKRNDFTTWRELVVLYCRPKSDLRTSSMISLVERLIRGRVSGMSQRGRKRLEETKKQNK